MKCEFCQGTGKRDRVFRADVGSIGWGVCPECNGTGIADCCNGMTADTCRDNKPFADNPLEGSE